MTRPPRRWIARSGAGLVIGECRGRCARRAPRPARTDPRCAGLWDHMGAGRRTRKPSRGLGGHHRSGRAGVAALRSAPCARSSTTSRRRSCRRGCAGSAPTARRCSPSSPRPVRSLSTSSTSPSSTASARSRTRSPGTHRYREAGLATLGDPLTTLSRSRGSEPRSSRPLERLGVVHPVAVDSGLLGLARLRLRRAGRRSSSGGRESRCEWFHFGEGEYAATEAAICAELAAIDPALRAAAAPSSRCGPPTRPSALVGAADPGRSSPGGSPSEPWETGLRRRPAGARLRGGRRPRHRRGRGRADGSRSTARLRARSQSTRRGSTTSPCTNATSAIGYA